MAALPRPSRCRNRPTTGASVTSRVFDAADWRECRRRGEGPHRGFRRGRPRRPARPHGCRSLRPSIRAQSTHSCLRRAGRRGGPGPRLRDRGSITGRGACPLAIAAPGGGLPPILRPAVPPDELGDDRVRQQGIRGFAKERRQHAVLKALDIDLQRAQPVQSLVPDDIQQRAHVGRYAPGCVDSGAPEIAPPLGKPYRVAAVADRAVQQPQGACRIHLQVACQPTEQLRVGLDGHHPAAGGRHPQRIDAAIGADIDKGASRRHPAEEALHLDRVEAVGAQEQPGVGHIARAIQPPAQPEARQPFSCRAARANGPWPLASGASRRAIGSPVGRWPTCLSTTSLTARWISGRRPYTGGSHVAPDEGGDILADRGPTSGICCSMPAPVDDASPFGGSPGEPARAGSLSHRAVCFGWWCTDSSRRVRAPPARR